MSKPSYDFGGYATKYGVKCGDGRTIEANSFKHQDGVQIPVVWNHDYDGPDKVLGHAVLEHREDGVYAYGYFNDSETADSAKRLIKHGDIKGLSICANRLSQRGKTVTHGQIRELSLVLAGANPEASICEVIAHNSDEGETAIIWDGEFDLELAHADNEDEGQNDGETIVDIYKTLTEKQHKAVMYILDQFMKDQEKNNVKHSEGEDDMKKNIFENQEDNKATLKHGECLKASLADGKRFGSLKESVLAHTAEYGIEDIEELFPVEHLMEVEPSLIDNDNAWVETLLNGVTKVPFSRLKSMYSDINTDEVRAKGYVKGNLKSEAVVTLLKRVTSPQTVYTKQKIDRDDIIDIKDFDVVSWYKKILKLKLKEEIGLAILKGDGRSTASADKIKEDKVRPVYNDADLYTIKYGVAGAMSSETLIDSIIASRVDYKGTGLPTLFVTEGELIKMLLIKDTTNRFIYADEAVLAKTLRVKNIVTVPELEGLVRATTDNKTHNVKAILFNMKDYSIGMDKGGQTTMFEDFDIDYNQHKALIETRMSGSLMKPYSAIVVEEVIS